MRNLFTTKKFLTTAMALALSTALFVGAADAKTDDGHGSAANNGKSAVHSVSQSKSNASESAQFKVKLIDQSDNELTDEVKNEEKMSKEQINKEKVKIVQERVRAKIEANTQTKAELKKLKDIEDHWAQDAILRMQLLGVVGGYEDGAFKPQNEVTQAEAISLIVRLFYDEDAYETIDDVEETDQEDTVDRTDEEEFADVPVWVRGAAKQAKIMGVLNPNRFHSQVQASRAQTAVWIAKAMGLEPVDTSNVNFSDKSLISSEDIGYIMALVNEGYLKGTSEGNFNPNSAITRAELVVIVDRIMQDQQETDQDETNDDGINIEETTDN